MGRQPHRTYGIAALTALGLALCRGPICSHRKARPCPDHLEHAEAILDRLMAAGFEITEMDPALDHDELHRGSDD